jgi:DNA-binding response OmpR family regulator
VKKNYRVLIVEDQAITALEVKQIISEMGLDVVGIAKSNKEAIKKFKEYQPDIVIMDIGLEGERNGISTTQDLYEIGHTNIVYLTAFTDEKTIDSAIKTNPLAYEIKPFSKASLQSTIKIVVIKLDNEILENQPVSNFDLGYGYSFNMSTRELFFNDSFIKLGKQEAHLLYLLIKAKGETVTYTQIEYEIWENSVISESSIRTLIWRLRTRLEHKIIKTESYRGVKLLLDHLDTQDF